VIEFKRCKVVESAANEASTTRLIRQILLTLLLARNVNIFRLVVCTSLPSAIEHISYLVLRFYRAATLNTFKINKTDGDDDDDTPTTTSTTTTAEELNILGCLNQVRLSVFGMLNIKLYYHRKKFADRLRYTKMSIIL
jgi:hypothetical protein